MNMKSWLVALCLPPALAACAGGSNVDKPKVFVALPQAKALDFAAENIRLSDDKAVTFSTGGGQVAHLVKTNVFYGIPSYENKFAYQTSDGKYYEFNSLNTMLVPSGSSPSKVFPTTQLMQATDNGGKLFACCHGTHRDAPAADMLKSYYGAWIAPNGESSVFSGGVLADAAYMQGGAQQSGKGKATYDVMAVRVKDGGVVNSSYTPKDSVRADSPELVSQLTVNFNTGKLGGEIIGNADFGDSIVMQDVSVNGNTFSGTAVSGGATGAVSGGFYGSHDPGSSIPQRAYAGSEIGGVVDFGNKALDAAFGGTRTAIDVDTASTDLTPVSR